MEHTGFYWSTVLEFQEPWHLCPLSLGQESHWLQFVSELKVKRGPEEDINGLDNLALVSLSEIVCVRVCVHMHL